MGPLGVPEMMGIFVIALLLFGPKKLPELGRMLGKGLSEFRRAKSELTSTFETHMKELERESRLVDEPKITPPSFSSDTSYSSAQYPYPYDEYGQQGAYDSSSGAYNGTEVPVPSSETAVSSETAAVPDQASHPSAPVTGAVPRSQPASSAEPVAVSHEENHSA